MAHYPPAIDAGWIPGVDRDADSLSEGSRDAAVALDQAAFA
jgi:hypothetical protein